MPDFEDIPINATAEELEAVARMGTAPEDGKTYGRKNGEWVEAIDTNNYNDLSNKPQINSTTLQGNTEFNALDFSAVPQVTGEFLYNNGTKIEDQRWWNKTVQCTTNYEEYQAWYFYKIRNDGDGAVRTNTQPLQEVQYIQKTGSDLNDFRDLEEGNIYQCVSDYAPDHATISNDTQFHKGYFYLFNGYSSQYYYTRIDVQPTSGGGAVTSVNGKTGVVVLNASDVGALPNNTPIPTKTSDLTNDSGFIDNTANNLSNYYDKTAVDNKLADKQNVIDSNNKLPYTLLSDTPTIPTVDQTYDGTSANAQSGVAVASAISGKEDTSNKVTSISAQSTDTQYPSAKCVYDMVGDIETALDTINDSLEDLL